MQHTFFAPCLTVFSCLSSALLPSANTDLKHLTLIRINSGREEANSPQYLK